MKGFPVIGGTYMVKGKPRMVLGVRIMKPSGPGKYAVRTKLEDGKESSMALENWNKTGAKLVA